VTVIVGAVMGLTFLFAFGNIATLGIRLGSVSLDDPTLRAE